MTLRSDEQKQESIKSICKLHKLINNEIKADYVNAPQWRELTVNQDYLNN